MHRLRQLRDAGVSIWLDTLSRDMLDDGTFAELVADACVTGTTTNPTIFAAAIGTTHAYDEQVRRLLAAGATPEAVYLELAADDVRRAADILRPVYGATGGGDGYVSIQCTPDLADDAKATVDQARMLWRRIARPNAMIKVPATTAGINAAATLIADGINVNFTLVFSVGRYDQAVDAYFTGLEQRVERHQSIRDVASVVSVFVSRIDTAVDDLLPDASPLRGRVAVASAAAAYHHHVERLDTPRWERLAIAGAGPQRPLWASTGAKNREYPDLLYVTDLIAAETVNTMPLETLHAFADHGSVGAGVMAEAVASEVLDAVLADGLDLDDIAANLEREGVTKFTASYEDVLERIAAIGRQQRSAPWSGTWPTPPIAI